MRADGPRFSTPHPVTVLVEGVALAAVTIGICAIGTLAVSRIFLNRLVRVQARSRQRKLVRRQAPFISRDRSPPPSSP